MFGELADKLDAALKKIRGHGKITEKNVTEALRDVRLALLEADVNYKVVKQFTEDVKAKALGAEVLASITPDQQFIRIVFDELSGRDGRGRPGDRLLPPIPRPVIMLIGLQGSGKTTAAAKLARRFRQKGKNGILIAADVYRPAAIDQLETLGKSIPGRGLLREGRGKPGRDSGQGSRGRPAAHPGLCHSRHRRQAARSMPR